VLLRDLELVASVTDFAVYLVFLAVNSTLVILRMKAPNHRRGFVVPGRIGAVPVLPVLAFAAVVVMITQLDLLAIGLGLVLLLLGLLVYLVIGAVKPRELTE
jgi:APA family basic amino acid/polyamine antiporter